MTVQNILPSFPVTMKNMIVGWFISYRITTSAVQRQKSVSAYLGTFKSKQILPFSWSTIVPNFAQVLFPNFRT